MPELSATLTHQKIHPYLPMSLIRFCFYTLDRELLNVQRFEALDVDKFCAMTHTRRRSERLPDHVVDRKLDDEIHTEGKHVPARNVIEFFLSMSLMIWYYYISYFNFLVLQRIFRERPRNIVQIYDLFFRTHWNSFFKNTGSICHDVRSEN